MKVPLSWLRDFVDFDDDAAGLAGRLTFSGIEVEGIERVREGLAGIVAGEIVEMSKLPDSDHLHICRVFDGKETVQVVCGAGNMKTGDKSAFARIGVTLPGGLKIKRTKIRGTESFGMLCAEDELGLSDDHSGIIILDPQIETGTPLSKVYGEPDDVLDLEITWNRPDCLSIIGIAREVAALYGSSVKIPDVVFPESETKVTDYISVVINDYQACPRYTGRFIQGVKTGPSPLWMQARLAACGMRPINNLVDITNYVLLETGHPMHAFDYARVSQGKIVVRAAAIGEKIVTLDGAVRVLNQKILVIADNEKALAVAGVMGGDGSQIADNTKDVLLESAVFDPVAIHGAVSSLAVSTDSSHRFERGVSFDSADFAGRRAVELMCAVAGGVAAKGVVDCHAGAPAERKVILSMKSLCGVMGIDIQPDEACRILQSLQFQPVSTADGFEVKIPGFRLDIEIEADLIEEVARMKGLDAIPAIAPLCHTVASSDDRVSWKREELRDLLVSLGLTEVVNYSFISPDLAALSSNSAGIPLPNPVSSDYSIMRGSLCPQMIDLLGRNLSRQTHDCSCFEIGKTFGRQPDGKICENEMLAVGLMGRVGRYTLDRVSKVSPEEIFQWGKGIIESIFSRNGIFVRIETQDSEVFDSGAAVRLLNDENKTVGIMGLLKQDIRAAHRMQEPVFIAELAVSPLVRHAVPCAKIVPIPSFPHVARDIAVIVKEQVTHGEILEAIESAGCPCLTRIELFDIFRSGATGDRRKSMAYSLRFQSMDKTLTDKEANGFRDMIRDVLVNKLDAEIREG